MPAIPGEMRLWPGHGPTEPGAWAPPAYPLSEREAHAFLDSIDLLSEHDLDAMRHSLSRGSLASEIEARGEMADLLEFAGMKPGLQAIGLARIQAQQLLLWRWRWEERRAEIYELERLCQLVEKKLPRELQGLDTEADQECVPSGILHCSWRPVVANAAFFLPPELPLLAAEEMADDLLDCLEFEDAGPLRQAIAPLWRALGYSRPDCGLASDIYNCDRTWLISKK